MQGPSTALLSARTNGQMHETKPDYRKEKGEGRKGEGVIGKAFSRL